MCIPAALDQHTERLLQPLNGDSVRLAFVNWPCRFRTIALVSLVNVNEIVHGIDSRWQAAILR